MKCRVVIVDDHPAARLGLVTFFGNRTEFEVAGACGLGEAAGEIVERQRPDIVVVDVANRNDCRLQIARFKAASPRALIVVYSSLDNVDAAVRALEAGASGVASKGADMEDLAIAALRVMRGDSYLDPVVAGAVVARMRAAATQKRADSGVTLSLREEQVMRGLMKGQTNKQIAATLKLSEKTVKHYVGTIKDKYNARNRLEIVISARERQLAS